MPVGPFNGRRPGTDSTLVLTIREIPVPTGDNEGFFPPNLIRSGADEESLTEDIASRTEFATDDISIDIQNRFTRGLGQTDVYRINLNVSGKRPGDVMRTYETLTDAGYKFESAEFN